MSSKQLPPNMQQTVVSGHTFSIASKFDLSTAKILGRGSYGVVTTAFDPDRNELIAIKRIRPYANDEWDARHTLREIRLLKLLGPHPNVSFICRGSDPMFILVACRLSRCMTCPSSKRKLNFI
jgi:serine/threonine protein kinase